jgi:cellulose biosynthesis protein BcsQ
MSDDTDEVFMLVTSQFKDGCGKTTIAIHLAEALVDAGYNILLVDGDPQGIASAC